MEASRSEKTDDLELHEIKADVYETWAVMNRAFEQIITALNKLEKTGVLKWDYVHNQSVMANDLWTRINTQNHGRCGQARRGRPQPLWENEGHAGEASKKIIRHDSQGQGNATRCESFQDEIRFARNTREPWELR
jgi:hypothetical protein